MGAGKNKVRRKKRISKHVQDAEERRRKKPSRTAERPMIDRSYDHGEKNETTKSNRHIKDPSEARRTCRVGSIVRLVRGGSLIRTPSHG